MHWCIGVLKVQEFFQFVKENIPNFFVHLREQEEQEAADDCDDSRLLRRGSGLISFSPSPQKVRNHYFYLLLIVLLN